MWAAGPLHTPHLCHPPPSGPGAPPEPGAAVPPRPRRAVAAVPRSVPAAPSGAARCQAPAAFACAPARCSWAGRRFCGWGGTGRGAEAALCCSHQQLQKGLSRALFLLSQSQTSFQLNLFFRQFSSSDWTKGNLRQKPLFCCCCICFRDCGYLLRGACSSTSTPADGDFQGHRSASLKEVRSPLECFAVQI